MDHPRFSFCTAVITCLHHVCNFIAKLQFKRGGIFKLHFKWRTTSCFVCQLTSIPSNNIFFISFWTFFFVEVTSQPCSILQNVTQQESAVKVPVFLGRGTAFGTQFLCLVRGVLQLTNPVNVLTTWTPACGFTAFIFLAWVERYKLSNSFFKQWTASFSCNIRTLVKASLPASLFETWCYISHHHEWCQGQADTSYSCR